MRSILVKAALKTVSTIAGNNWGQSLLEKAVAAAQYAQGIGSGENVASSGEMAVISRLAATAHADGRSLCIFDVGANTGQFLRSTCAGLRAVRFQLHSFEPGFEAYRQLSQIAEKYPNVILNNFGLGREPSERDLYYHAPGSALASLSKRRLTHFETEMSLSEKVKIEMLDDYCSAREIGYIDLLKIDVEGHELDVLNGANRMFCSSSIGMVVFEFGGCNIDTRSFVQDFFYFFSDRNMRMARITPSGYFREIPSYREILEQFRTTNFLCYRV